MSKNTSDTVSISIIVFDIDGTNNGNIDNHNAITNNDDVYVLK
jgi:hypothetical protein